MAMGRNVGHVETHLPPWRGEGDTILPPFIIVHSGVTNSPSFRVPQQTDVRGSQLISG